jgi:hypothetical protein
MKHAGTAPQRKAYGSPTLVSYGDLSEMTKGTGMSGGQDPGKMGSSQRTGP